LQPVHSGTLASVFDAGVHANCGASHKDAPQNADHTGDQSQISHLVPIMIVLAVAIWSVIIDVVVNVDIESTIAIVRRSKIQSQWI